MSVEERAHRKRRNLEGLNLGQKENAEERTRSSKLLRSNRSVTVGRTECQFLNDASPPDIRSSWHSVGGRSAIAGSRQQLAYQHEFENLICGLRIGLLLVFVPPLVLGTFIFVVAALFPAHYPTARVLVPNDCWRTFLSITVRIGLIPGLMVLIYQTTCRRRNSQRRRFLAISLSVLLISVFAFVPFRLQPQPVMASVIQRHPEMEHVSSKTGRAKLPLAMHSVAKVDSCNDLQCFSETA